MPAETPIDFEELLAAAVGEILRHEDPERFRGWLDQNLSRFIVPGARDMVPPEMASMLAPTLARAIWNVTPLPGNRFRPAPLPAPGRNDPCPCGSGRKFKRCCAAAPQFTEISTEMMWEFALEEMSPQQLAQALAHKQVPVAGLARMAADFVEGGDAGRAVALLGPLFDEQPLASLRSEAYEYALDMLCNAYDDLDEDEDKRALLERVTREAARSPLRAGAWQRLAAVRSDEGDAAAGWEAFRQAQRDQPDAPALAQLEVILLASEGRTPEIAERAKHWVRRLRRQGFEEGEPLIEWLQAAARDPAGALADLGIRDSGGEGEFLRDWLASVRERPLPRYALQGAADAPAEQGPPQSEEEALAARLRAMGVAEDRLAEVLGQLREDLAAMRSGNGAEDDPEDGDSFGVEDDPEDGELFGEADDSLVLCAPEALRAVESDWRSVYRASKPFSVNELPMAGPSPWDDEEEWSAFLAGHPEAFDSLDILDDLATTAMEHEAHGDPAFDRLMLLPLLERARAILEAAVAGRDTPRLAWVITENRPALRAMVRLMALHLDFDERAQATAVAERVMTLNPGDNHGLRGLLMEEYLLDGRDEEALALAGRFPGDMLADTSYGRALALHRLGRKDEAHEAVAEAVERLPKVRDYLVRKRIREPDHDLDRGLAIGGDEQAWQYREAMLPAWAGTPGALDLLTGAVPRKRPR